MLRSYPASLSAGPGNPPPARFMERPRTVTGVLLPQSTAALAVAAADGAAQHKPVPAR